MESNFVFIYGPQYDIRPRRQIRCKVNDRWYNGHLVKRGLVDDYRFYTTDDLERFGWDGKTILDAYSSYFDLAQIQEIAEIGA